MEITEYFKSFMAVAPSGSLLYVTQARAQIGLYHCGAHVPLPFQSGGIISIFKEKIIFVPVDQCHFMFAYSFQ